MDGTTSEVHQGDELRHSCTTAGAARGLRVELRIHKLAVRTRRRLGDQRLRWLPGACEGKEVGSKVPFPGLELGYYGFWTPGILPWAKLEICLAAWVAEMVLGRVLREEQLVGFSLGRLLMIWGAKRMRHRGSWNEHYRTAYIDRRSCRSRMLEPLDREAYFRGVN